MGITGPVPVVKHADTKIEIAKNRQTGFVSACFTTRVNFSGTRKGGGEIQINEGGKDWGIPQSGIAIYLK